MAAFRQRYGAATAIARRVYMCRGPVTYLRSVGEGTVANIGEEARARLWPWVSYQEVPWPLCQFTIIPMPGRARHFCHVESKQKR